MQVANAQQLMQMTGATSAAEINRPPNRFYIYPFLFATIAAGAPAQIAIKQETGGTFVVDQIVGSAWLPTAPGGGVATIALTPLHANPDPSPPATVGNTHIPLNALRCYWQTNDYAHMQSPMKWVNVIGSIFEPNVNVFNPVIAPGSNMLWTVYNDSALVVAAEIALIGHLITK